MGSQLERLLAELCPDVSRKKLRSGRTVIVFLVCPHLDGLDGGDSHSLGFLDCSVVRPYTCTHATPLHVGGRWPHVLGGSVLDSLVLEAPVIDPRLQPCSLQGCVDRFGEDFTDVFDFSAFTII